jgi:hypothetical protein
MASTSAPVPRVSTIDAVQAAIDHTRRHLFPIRPGKWIVLGFLSFLDQCGRTLHGGLGPEWKEHVGPGFPRGGRGFGEGVRDAVEAASAWLSAHSAAVAVGAVVGLLVVAGLVALVLWINARGSFMYLDDVASGRADVARPWREHAVAAGSYFGWRLALAFVTFGVVLFALGLVATVAVGFARGRLEGAPLGVVVLALAPVLLVLLVALPLLALAGMALRDFVAPLQLLTGLPCGASARVLEGLLTDHPGAFLLYLVVKLLVVLLTGVAVVIGGCLTCCIGFLPVVLQTLLQPLFFFERSFPLFLLKQMGHDLPARLGG